MTLLQQLQAYEPVNEQEIGDKQLILDYVKANESDVLTRENKVAHLTVSAFVVNEDFDKVLMAYHHLYQSFAWLGGHADGDVQLLRVALKEACEESGITTVQPLTTDIVAMDVLPVYGHVKHQKWVSTHLHLNVTYLLVTSEDQALVVKPDENSAVAWLPLNELEKYCQEPKMLPIYQKVIQKLSEIKPA